MYDRSKIRRQLKVGIPAEQHGDLAPCRLEDREEVRKQLPGVLACAPTSRPDGSGEDDNLHKPTLSRRPRCFLEPSECWTKCSNQERSREASKLHVTPTSRSRLS